MNLATNHCRDVLLTVWLLAGLLPALPVRAAPDDADSAATDPFPGDEDPFAAPRVAQDFDEQWIFQSVGNANGARDRFRAQLAVRLDDLLHSCQLTTAQQDKLRLAAAVDDGRFFAEVAALHDRFTKVRQDQQALQALWMDIAGLQQRLMTGPYDDQSFFGKSLHALLGPEQQQSYRRLTAERAQFRYRVGVEIALVTVDDELGLSDQQYADILKLVLAETSPPESGNYDSASIWAQIGKVPPDKLRSLLSERQWKRFGPRLGAVPMLPQPLGAGGFF